jgi:CRP/FNR family transcriptional regulator, cyclic AMP receptor protein
MRSAHFVTTPPNRLHRLRDIELFAHCTARELRLIDSLTTTVGIEAGRVLCRAGDIGRECFVLLDGRADVGVNDRHQTVGRGALVGEIALLTPRGRRTATATAVTDLTVLVFSRTEFGRVMTGIPIVAHAILREATRRLVENDDEA